MPDNKKYYYLKLKDNFFDSEEMKILESQKNGIEYQNLYLKLCLLSLKSNGKLIFKEYLPYDVNMLSTVLRINIDTVKTGLEIFVKLGLVDILDTGLIYMTDIQSLIGRGSSEAERIKEYREKIKNDKGVQMYEKCTPEKEIEKELEIEIEKEIELEKKTKRKKFDYEESFNIFYELYNYPFNKIQAQDEWKKIDPELHQEIYNHVREYRTRGQGVDFPFKPNNYLKRKRWTEGIISDSKKDNRLSLEENKKYWEKLCDEVQ